MQLPIPCSHIEFIPDENHSLDKNFKSEFTIAMKCLFRRIFKKITEVCMGTKVAIFNTFCEIFLQGHLAKNIWSKCSFAFCNLIFSSSNNSPFYNFIYKPDYGQTKRKLKVKRNNSCRNHII